MYRFIKLALETGASLVPVFSFGEVDIYDQVSNPHGSALRRLQEFILNRFGFTLPIVKGVEALSKGASFFL